MVKSHQPPLKALEMTAQIHCQRDLNSAGKTVAHQATERFINFTCFRRLERNNQNVVSVLTIKTARLHSKALLFRCKKPLEAVISVVIRCISNPFTRMHLVNAFNQRLKPCCLSVCVLLGIKLLTLMLLIMSCSTS